MKEIEIIGREKNYHKYKKKITTNTILSRNLKYLSIISMKKNKFNKFANSYYKVNI